MLLLFPGSGVLSGGGPGAITLAAGDLTTALSKWLDTVAAPENESVRSTLTTAYSISAATDATTVLSRWLRTRSAP